MVRVWDTDSGLPHSTVMSLAQTPDGYLWIGTMHGGLARFDGTRFVNFDPGNTPELKSIEIHKLLVDDLGTLWIGNVEGGLISQREGQFKFEYWNNDTPRSWVEGIIACRPGCIDFSTRPGMIFRRTEKSGTVQWQILAPPDAYPVAMPCEDLDGTIWYRSSNGQIGLMRSTNVVKHPSFPGLSRETVNVLTKDSLGHIWIGTTKGIAMWNGTAFEYQPPANDGSDTNVRQMLPDKDGGFWILTAHHLQRFEAGAWVCCLGLDDTNDSLSKCSLQLCDANGGVWLWSDTQKITYVDPDGKVSWIGDAHGKLVGVPWCWLEDQEGNVWVGLNEGGLARLRPRLFHTTWPTSGVDSRAARSVCQNQDGTMWFGTGGKEVLRLSDGYFKRFAPVTTRSFEDIKVSPTGDGDLWVGSVQNGLLRLHDGDFSRPFDEKRIGTVVRCLLSDQGEGVWIGSEFGLFKWDGKQLRDFNIKDGFTPAYILALARETNGDLWCGTALGELRRWHNNTFTFFRPKDTLTEEATFNAAAAANPLGEQRRGALSGGERFWALHLDKSRTLWVGSLGGGLLRFKNGQFTRFTARQDLPSEHVSQILEDDRNQLWLGTRAGIVRVSIQELNAYADGGHVLPNFVSYGKFDGLPALECSGGSQPACWRSADGHLWFTTVRGAVWVDPAALRINRRRPPVHIEEVSVDSQRITDTNSPARAPKAIRVRAGRHYFEFTFCALSFNAPEKVKFRWRLSGLESEWVDGGNQRTATYSYVPPGKYRFEVKACNNDGIWNVAPAMLEVTVLPFFWQEWWFKLAVSLAALGLGLAIYSFRVSRLRSLERLRLRIARDLHDEVGANLGSISLLAQMMEQSPSSSDATLVRGIAIQTIDTLRDIIWFIDPKHDKLIDLVQRLEETARIMLANLKFTLQQSGDFRSADLSLTFRRNVPPLFKETLHNILKHSHATEVRIQIRKSGDDFLFDISDNGRGFDLNQKSSGNGLRNLRRRAGEIGGSVEIESSPGKGTTVHFRAPITQTRDWFNQKS